MKKKPLRKPSKAKPIDANESYEYEYSPDGDRLNLRFMSHRERDRLLNSLMFILISHVNTQAKRKREVIDAMTGELGVDVPTSAQLNEGFKPFHDEICSLIEKIGIGKAAEVVSEWNDFGDYDIVAGLVLRIVAVEQALNADKDAPAMEPYPTPEAILEMTDKEALELGEDSQPSTNPSGTSPSDAQAEISSSGAKSTTD